MKRSIILTTLVLVLFSAVAAAPAPAQQGPAAGAGRRMAARMAAQADPLSRLANILERAGAPALTTDEQTQLTTLITNFRNANAPQPPSDAVKSAHQNLDNAVLSGDATGAAAQVTVIVSNQSAQTTARMQAQANFAIDVIKILRANGQIDPLLKQFGDAGVVRMAMSLAAGPGWGAGMRQGALRMRPPQNQN